MKLVSAENLIDDLLADQQSLTAVERFSQTHKDTAEPLLRQHYRSLLPLSEPADGEQYSFEVDLDACSGCKACVTACHSMNGLDDGESWRDVGSLVSHDTTPAVQQTVTSACHHCADPACANGCPTLAYEKEADTGIVRHLDDQCIGCQYCTMMCPYDVPKYNDRLGIVRKCDMCQSRLREGEAPACVQACPNEAIRIRIVPVPPLGHRPGQGIQLLPGTAPSHITLPTTKFVNLRDNDGITLSPADEVDLRPAHSHVPLVWMLVVTQAAAGILLFDLMARFLLPQASPPGTWHAVTGAILAIVGLGTATMHLGRPLQAWKSFLGWRKSWLSREILVFGPWAGLALAYAASLYLALPSSLVTLAATGAAVTGLLGVFCSVMVYASTRRAYWSFFHTLFRFALTLLILGSCFVFPIASCIAASTKIAFEILIQKNQDKAFLHSTRVIQTALKCTWRFRLAAGCIGIAFTALSPLLPTFVFLGFAVLFTGELLARTLYFRAVQAPRMPGGIPAS